MTANVIDADLVQAERLRAARRRARLSQGEVADKLGVREKTVWRWERAETKGYEQHLEALADLYGTTVGELTGADTAARVTALELELREMRELLSDPQKLRDAADRLMRDEEVD